MGGSGHRAIGRRGSLFSAEGIELVTARTHVPEVPTNATAGKWLAENGEIEEAARRLMCCGPACFAYVCTTASVIRGVGFDRDINQRITQATGRPATSTSTAMIQALKSLDVTRIALASPYLPDAEAAFIAFLEGHGFEIVNSVAMNLSTDHSRVDATSYARRRGRSRPAGSGSCLCRLYRPEVGPTA